MEFERSGVVVRKGWKGQAVWTHAGAVVTPLTHHVNMLALAIYFVGQMAPYKCHVGPGVSTHPVICIGCHLGELWKLYTPAEQPNT